MGNNISLDDAIIQENGLSLIEPAYCLKVGFYRLATERRISKFVFVPSQYIRQPFFSIAEVLQVLELSTPQRFFNLDTPHCTSTWNLVSSEASIENIENKCKVMLIDNKQTNISSRSYT